MNPERLVKFGMVGVGGIITAVMGGYALANYAVGGATASYAAIDPTPAYVAKRAVESDYDASTYVGASVAPASVIVSPMPADVRMPPPVKYDSDFDMPRYADVSIDDAPPAPTRLLPEADVAEDAAATGDTARAEPTALAAPTEQSTL